MPCRAYALATRLLRASLVVVLTSGAAFAQLPRIDSVSPTQGPIAGGTVVTISGASFAGVAVTLDGSAITPLSQTDTQITLTMPPHDNGYALIRAGSAIAEFLYVPPKLSDLPPGYITTVAGVGRFARDYGAATQANIGTGGIVLDHAGNLLIADTAAYIIYRVHPDGTIERFAGGATPTNDEGDGGPATNAFVLFPRGVAVDGNDNVYLPDVRCRIRRVDRNGIITTVAGTGVCGFSGDGGPATHAQIGQPTHVAADANDCFFIDYDAKRIRRLHFADGTISTFAGNGTVGESGDGGAATEASFHWSFDDAGDLALDPSGNLAVIDDAGGHIRRIDRATGIITSIYPADQGTRSITFDRAGNLYVGRGGSISKVDASGKLLTTWGNGKYGPPVDGEPASTGSIDHVMGLAIDGRGNVIYSDDAVQRVRRIDIDSGLLETVAGIGPNIIGENGPAIATVVEMSPESAEIAMDAAGELLIGDAAAYRLRKLDANGNIATIAGTGLQGGGSLSDGVPATSVAIYPVGIDLASDGAVRLAQRASFVRIDANGLLSRIGARDSGCALSGDGGTFAQAHFCQPWDMTHDRDGNLYIADTNNNRVRRVDAKTNLVTTIAGNGGPVSGFERYGYGQSCGDGGRAIDACINTPYGVAVDDAGNIFVAEQTGIRRIDASGTISMFAALPGYPHGGVTKMHFGPIGQLFTVFGNAPLRIDKDGHVTRLINDNRGGFGGDGGPARDARTNTGGQAVGIAIDAEGNLYFPDVVNHRIRAIRFGAYLAPQNAAITASRSGTTIRALVVDAGGHPAPSVRVDFSVPSSGASCVLSNPFGITDENGVAVVTCTPNCIEGTYSLNAQPLSSSATARLTLTNSIHCHPRAARH